MAQFDDAMAALAGPSRAPPATRVTLPADRCWRKLGKSLGLATVRKARPPKRAPRAKWPRASTPTCAPASTG